MLGVGRWFAGGEHRSWPAWVMAVDLQAGTAMVCGWVVMGTSLWAMLRGPNFKANLAQSWYVYTAIVAMAVDGGFA